MAKGQYRENGYAAFNASEAIAAYLRVKMTANSNEVALADAEDSEVGVSILGAAISTPVTVSLINRAGTQLCVAQGEISINAVIYGAIDGKVSASATTRAAIGVALEAASGTGAVIECSLNNGAGAVLSAANTQNYSDTILGLPFILNETITFTTNETKAVIASFPRKARLVMAWMIARDTNAANITLKNASTAMTAATAKGGTNDAPVMFTSIIAAYDEVAAADALNLTGSAACAVDLVLIFNPIA